MENKQNKQFMKKALYSYLILVFIIFIASLEYKYNANLFENSYISKIAFSMVISIYPVYITIKHYSNIIAKSFKPANIAILLLISFIPVLFSQENYIDRIYAWVHYLFLVALPEEFFFRVYLTEQFNEGLLRYWKITNVSAYIIGSLFANVLWGVTHIIFPLVNNVNNLEPLWSYITFGIGNGLLYTALFLIFRKNVSAPVLFHAVKDMCNKLL